MADEPTAELPKVAVGGEEVQVATLQAASSTSAGPSSGLSQSPTLQEQTLSPTNGSLETKGGVEKSSREQKELGIVRCVERCWEYQKLVVRADSLEEIRVISAWFGHPENETQRVDITADVSVIFGENGFAVGATAADVPRSSTVELHASCRKWGDPASLCLKQLEVIYDRLWLTAEERSVVKSLQRRAQERALDAPDLEDLLERLGTALLSVAATSTAAPAVVPAADPTDPGIYPAECIATDAACAASAATPPPLNRISPRWKRLGFQACNPRTDLRTGCLALEALVYLAERYPLAATQMASEAQRDDVDYPFAVASINVTQLLVRYLGLVSDGASSSSVFNCVAPRHVLRVLARLMISTGREETKSYMPQVDVFGELHAAAMARLHATWRALKLRDPELTVMDFQRALDATMMTVHAFCTQRDLECPLDFRGLSIFDFGEDDPEVFPDSSGDASPGSLLSGADLLVSGATRLLASGADGLSGTAGLFASSASAAGGGLQAALNGGASRLSETAGQVGALFRVWHTEKEDESLDEADFL